ncbi:MAG: DASS family sodium-coupled anion symporter [Vicinamibacterales bacterium]
MAGAVVAAVGSYWFGRAATDDMAARAIAIFVLAAVLWAAEALPLFATALIVVSLEVLLLAGDGGLADEVTYLLSLAGPADEAGAGRTSIPAGAFLSPFASDIIMLFLGGFLMAAAVTRHGVDRVLARRLLQPFTRSPLALMYGLAGLSAFLSMWMSNTATAAMMIALSGPIRDQLPPGHRFRMALVLAIAFGANIGGIGTPIGTPPNAIAFGALNSAGYEISFLRWMAIAVPLEVLLLAGAGVLLHSRFRPEPGLRLALPSASGPLPTRGAVTLIVLVAAILLWMTGGWHGLGPGTVALLAAATLLVAGVITSADMDTVDWRVLILMWGALSLGVAVERSGLGAYLAGTDLSALPGGIWSVGAVIALAGVGLSTFMSNTAAAALLVPMALAVSIPGREEFAMLAAFACSFAMAMPVSTPPNALAYATGEIPRPAMVQAGGLVSGLGMVLMLIGFHLVLPLAF